MNKAYVDGHIEQTVDFDYDEIDRRMNEKELPPLSAKLEVVAAARLLHHIVVVGGTNPRETMLWVNVFLFVMGLHPNQNDSGEVVAQGLKTNKEEWFRRVTKMRRILGARGLFIPRIAGQWGASGRKSAANAALKSWHVRGGNPQIRISEADRKLNWIAEHLERINWNEMTPMARKELKAKLNPVVKIHKEL